MYSLWKEKVDKFYISGWTDLRSGRYWSGRYWSGGYQSGQCPDLVLLQKTGLFIDGPSLVFIPIFKYLVSSVLHGNLLCRHLQIIFISTAVILPKLYDVYIVHNIELQCWYLAMHPKTHGKVVEIASIPFFCLWSLNYPVICKHVQFIEQRWNTWTTDA